MGDKDMPYPQLALDVKDIGQTSRVKDDIIVQQEARGAVFRELPTRAAKNFDFHGSYLRSLSKKLCFFRSLDDSIVDGQFPLAVQDRFFISPLSGELWLIFSLMALSCFCHTQRARSGIEADVHVQTGQGATIYWGFTAPKQIPAIPLLWHSLILTVLQLYPHSAPSETRSHFLHSALVLYMSPDLFSWYAE